MYYLSKDILKDWKKASDYLDRWYDLGGRFEKEANHLRAKYPEKK